MNLIESQKVRTDVCELIAKKKEKKEKKCDNRNLRDYVST